ncbi:MAG: transporter substrate-binding domain-containing protein [Anaerolineales bacterium]|nr:transporter substrate-binding domain-containing protein [Anaerolineales bacterium]
MSVNRSLILLLLALSISSLVLVPIGGSLAQSGTSTAAAPTLIPPTKVPIATEEPTTFTASTQSGIVTLQQEGIIRVGTLYNVPPFVWLDEAGQLSGYEADIIRAIAEEIGVQVEFVQVTGETYQQRLLSGEVDILIGEQIHTRQAEEFYEFSHTYYYNEQRMVVREPDMSLYPDLTSLTDHRIAVVAGSRGEEALNVWMSHTGRNFQLVRFLSEDKALDALANGEVDGTVGELDDLSRAGRVQMSLVPESVQLDPYAIAFRRYDVNLRNLINRSLQRLYVNGTLPSLGAKWFPGQLINYAAFIPLYGNLQDDARTVADFPPDMPIPSSSTIDKILAGQPLLVAGLDMVEGGFYYESFLDGVSEDIVNELARRWGISVTILPNTYSTAADLVANRQADMAMNVRARWDGADRLDYTFPYHYTGDRIIVLEGSQWDSFDDFRRGQWIGYFQDSPEDKTYLESLGRTYSVYTFADSEQAIAELVTTRNVDALYGDSVRLLAFMERYPYGWRFLPEGFGPDSFQPIVIGLPRNDADFVSLVNWTLGEMYADGTLKQIWADNFDIGKWLIEYGIDVPHWMPNFPGYGDFLYNRQ